MLAGCKILHLFQDQHKRGSISLGWSNVLSISLPTLAIIKGLFEFGHAARQAASLPHRGTQTQATNNAGLPQQRPLEVGHQIWVLFKSLFIGCPSEMADPNIKPPWFWLYDAQILVQAIVWCGAVEMLAVLLEKQGAISDYTTWTVNAYGAFAAYFGVLGWVRSCTSDVQCS